MADGLLSRYARYYRYINPNTIIRKLSDTSVVFINAIPDIREAHADQETNVQSAEGVNIPTYTVYGNQLNFKRENYITGINIIGEGDEKLLFWTDNVVETREDGSIERTNEPRKINIERFKAANHLRMENGATWAETNFNRNATRDPKFLEEEISVIKAHPLGRVESGNNDEFTAQFSWIDITDYEYEACVSGDTDDDTCEGGDQFRIDGEADGDTCNPNEDGVTNCFKVILEDGEENFNQANRIFEDAFPRFSYRWRYIDGEYSPIAPFTNVAFVPATRFVQEIRRYSEGTNIAMTNAVLSLTIENISRGGTDVVAIDVLYKESISNTIYSIETIEIPENLRGFGFENFNVNKRSFYRSLPANQLNRPFDAVPRTAKSQEITANRITYGNYLENFEQPQEVNMIVVALDRPNLIEEGMDFPSDRADQRHIKSDRTYEIGLVYIDRFGRQGALLTGPQARYTTPFFEQGPQQFACVVQDDAPEWAIYYRYFIKDVSAEHYNVFAHGIWRDPIEPEFTWLQINSNDRNKIQDGDSLIVKGYWVDLAPNPNEHVHERQGTFQTIRTKYTREILDIEDNVPPAIQNKLDTAMNINPLFIGPELPPVAVEYLTCGVDADCGDGGMCVNGNCVDGNGNRIRDAANDAEYIGGPYNQDGYLPNAQGFYPNSQGDYPDLNGRYPMYPEPGGAPSYADDTGEYRFNTLGNFADASFFVRVPTGPVSPVTGADSNLDRGDTELFEGYFGGNPSGTQDYSYWFETGPTRDDSLLDLYYESGETFIVEEHLKRINRLDWSNCVQFEGNIEERRLDGGFNTVELGNSVRANIPQENYELRRVYNGLIFSGLYNDNSGINRLNEFILTDGITKELEPNYGSIQKLHTRDTNLIVFMEDKIFRILSDKDALYNADGSSNVTSTNLVLGQTTPFQAEYGISRNPESFCQYGQNIWFTDRNRGAVMQLTPANGQLFEISSNGMNDFFRDRLKSAERIIGAFDDYHDQVMISLQGYNVNDTIIGEGDEIPNDDGNQTVIYEQTTAGWVSRRSYIPDAASTLNNRFYSFRYGQVWQHNLFTPDDENNRAHQFYGMDFTASITMIFNDLPSSVKDFKTINYEGSSDWELAMTFSGLGDGELSMNNQDFPFVFREGKAFTPIVTTQPNYVPCDPVNEDCLEQDGVYYQEAGEIQKAGIKGFWGKVELIATGPQQEPLRELFSVGTEMFISTR